MTKEYKVTREQAEAEFDTMCDVVGIENDIDELEGEDREAFESNRKRVIKAIMTGKVTTEGGLPTVHCVNDDKVEFVEPTGDVYLQPVSKRETEMHRMYKMADALTKGGAKLARRKKVDYGVIMSITALFITL